MGTRRQAREQALQILYQVDLGAGALSLEDALSRFWEFEDEPTEPDVVEFARILVRGVSTRRDAIDTMISDASINWKLPRMSLVDRNILRIGAFELTAQDDIPASVSINEAIELGKRFGTSDSGSFINGILDRIARNLGVAQRGRKGR